MRIIMSIGIACLLSACATSRSAIDRAFERDRFESILTFSQADEDDEGIILLADSPVDAYRFLLAPGVSREDFFEAANAARQERAIKTSYTVHGARFDEQTARLVYRACSVDFGEGVIVADPACARRGPADGTPLARLALANAYMSEGNPVGSGALMDSIDASSFDNADLRALYLDLALTLADYRGYVADFATPAHDRLLVEVVETADALAALRPDDAEPLFSKAAALRDLGAYGESIALHERIADDYPDASERAQAAVARIMAIEGRPQEALAYLNRDRTSFDGNWVRAHGLVLRLLGRPKDAAIDYNWLVNFLPADTSGFYGLACSAAMLGDLDKAHAMLTQALALSKKYDSYYEDERDRADRRLAERHLASLRKGIAEGRTAPMPQICDGYYRDPPERRSRSPLLDELDLTRS